MGAAVRCKIVAGEAMRWIAVRLQWNVRFGEFFGGGEVGWASLEFWAAGGVKMGPYSVAEILLYPVKACRGLSVTSASICSTGFLYDRQWMVVSADKGRLFAMARFPKLALVQPSLPAAALRGEILPDDAALEINAPGMQPLKVSMKRSPMTAKAPHGERGNVVDVVVWTWSGKGVDEGPEAAAWWSTYLGCPARFVRFDPAVIEDRQVEFAPDGYVTAFTNTGQFLLASEASLEDLNKRLPNVLPMNRFRPNIIVRGPSAYEDDKWRHFIIAHAGSTASFLYVMPCARCKGVPSPVHIKNVFLILSIPYQVPTINMENPQGTGEEPLKTLATFRSGNDLGLKVGNGKQVYFGTYFVCDTTLKSESAMSESFASVEVGDSLSVLEM